MVISTVNQVIYNGDGINKAWPYTFQVIDKTDVHLILQDVDGTQAVLTSDYYIDEVNSTAYYPGYAPGAEPPEADQPPVVAEGQKLIVYRDLPLTQEADLGDAWPFSVIEKGLDKLTMLLQDVWGWSERNFMQLKEGAVGWAANNYPIQDVRNPVLQQDAATKDYVDKIIAGIVAEGNDVVVVDTVAVLRTTDLTDGMFAWTGGYSEIRDGGGGMYAVRTFIPGDVDDGENTIILDNGNVAEKLTEKYEVRNIATSARACCVALVDSNKHAILFDLSDNTEEAAADVISALSDVVNVDAVCISHYHHDHIGKYDTIFATVPHANCVWYIPADCDPTYYDTSAAYTALTTWISSNGNTYTTPEENETVRVNSVKITFNNCDLDYWYDNYAPADFNYNWTSMTAFAEFGGTTMQIMADLYTDGEAYFFNTLKAGRKADIYQAPHHGFIGYMDKAGTMGVAPKAVLCNFGTQATGLKNRSYESAIINFCNHYGIPCFDSEENGTFTIQTSNGELNYKGVEPVNLNGIYVSYASVKDAFSNVGDVYDGVSTGLKDVLETMDANTTIQMMVYSNYQIAIDLGLTTYNKYIMQISKFVGGIRNHLIDDSDATAFAFLINVYVPVNESKNVSKEYVIQGTYDSVNGYKWSGVNVPGVSILTMDCKKADASDTALVPTKLDSKTMGKVLDISSNEVSTAVACICRVTMTAKAEATSMDLTFGDETFILRNGASVSKIVQLSSSLVTYPIESATASTAWVTVSVEFISSYNHPSFPGA